MKQETKAEQIERLQGTLAEFRFLLKADREFMTALDRKYVEYLLGDGTYVGKQSSVLLPDTRYRIHRDYKPEQDKPVFEGYVLCEVFPKKIGELWFHYPTIHAKGDSDPIDIVSRFGCAGYVPKEKIRNEHIMLNAPFCYVDRTLNYWSVELTKQELEDGYIPATLGWVAFKETE